MATYRVFNLRTGEFLNIEETTMRKALCKAACLDNGVPIRPPDKLKTSTTKIGDYLITLGDFSILIRAPNVES